MLKKIGAVFICIFAFSGCGKHTEVSSFTAEMSLPPALSSLNNYQTQINLYDAAGTTLMAGPASLSRGHNGWAVDIPDLVAGDYLAEIQMIIPANATNAPAGLASLSLLTEPLMIARARRVFSLPGGNSSTHLAFRPIDFETNLDNDQDGLSNLNEYIGGFNPLLSDSDQDGIQDGSDAFPLDVSESLDEDRDGVGNLHDNCISVANPLQDNLDQDRLGDLCDPDRDNDGLSDADEARLGSNIRVTDTDQDGVVDGTDNCPVLANSDQVDHDGDHVGDLCDTDDDNDAVLDATDNCVWVANADQRDSDHNGEGDVCTDDDDGDGVIDVRDNCPQSVNADQDDFDRDGAGDACDPDDDNDTLTDEDELGLGTDHVVTNPQSNDTDGDSILDRQDNCPATINTDQADSDHDGDGDVCDCEVANAQITFRNAVFVSRNYGHDTASGAVNDPVRTLTRAIQIAQSSHTTHIYVSEGTFEESITLPQDMHLMGGFRDRENTQQCHNNHSHDTILTSGDAILAQVSVGHDTQISNMTMIHQGHEGASIVMEVRGVGSEGVLELSSCHLRGPATAHDDRSSQALVTHDVQVRAINNIIEAGSERSTIALDMYGDQDIELINNTIDASQSLQTAIALKIAPTTASPRVRMINNSLITGKLDSEFTDDQIVIYVQSHDLPQGLIQNNFIKGFRNSDIPLLFLNFDHYASTTSELNSLGNTTLTVTSNVTNAQALSELFADASAHDFHPILGSGLINGGVSPGVELLIDYDGQGRPEGAAYDIGAYEMH